MDSFVQSDLLDPRSSLMRPALPFALGTSALGQGEYTVAALMRRVQVLEAIVEAAQRDIETLQIASLRLVEAGHSSARGTGDGRSSERTRVELRLFGAFRAVVDGEALARWPARKARLLLAYLALERGRAVPKDVLSELFWPGATPERAANNLSICVHQLRETFGPAGIGLIEVRHGLYSLGTAGIEVDLWRFQASVSAGRRALQLGDTAGARESFREAMELSSVELLESEPYEEWTISPRSAVAAEIDRALSWLAADAAESKDWAVVIRFGEQMLQRDRCDEAAHRWLMLAFAEQGNRSWALRQFQLCEEALSKSLGVTPSDETMRLMRRI